MLHLKLFRQHETILLITLVVLSIAIGITNPVFFSYDNLFDILKNSVTPGILALGVLIVLISGSIDISFPAIAAGSMYVTCRIAQQWEYLDHIVLLLIVAAAIGCLLGWINAALVHYFRLQALIVTLGTASLIRGGLLAFIDTRILINIPESLLNLSKLNLFEIETASGGQIGFSITVIIFFTLAVLTHLILTRTMLGRGIYALGGDPEAAHRVGFNISRIQFFIFGFMGMLSGIVGIFHASKMRNANPFDLTGIELTVIAAVVLGGTSITGGKGSVLGTVLGVLLLVVLANSMILLELPSQWHLVATGLIIIISTGITSWRNRAQNLAGELI